MVLPRRRWKKKTPQDFAHVLPGEGAKIVPQVRCACTLGDKRNPGQCSFRIETQERQRCKHYFNLEHNGPNGASQASFLSRNIL
jgi:hypothetical protein